MRANLFCLLKTAEPRVKIWPVKYVQPLALAAVS